MKHANLPKFNKGLFCTPALDHLPVKLHLIRRLKAKQLTKVKFPLIILVPIFLDQ